MKVRLETKNVLTSFVKNNEIYLVKKQLIDHITPRYCLFIKAGDNCIYISDDGKLAWDKGADASIKSGEIVILEKVTNRVEIILHNESIE